jgi:HPt (histidine-containing phosphotransfer) domain-containing protein
MKVVNELLSLSDDGDPELLLDLIRLFLEDGPSKVAAISEGLQATDFDKMERAAHALKGSAGNLGARLLQGTCEKMQSATRQKQLDDMRELTAQLQQNFVEVKKALEELRRQYSS